MLKTILITLAVLGFIAAAGMAWAKQSGYCSPENRLQKITERVGRKLDLNDDQQGRLEAFAKTLRDLRNERQDLGVAMKSSLKELLSEPSLDRDRAIALIDGRYESMSDSKLALVDAFADFSDSLAPEQRSRLADLVGDRMVGRWGQYRWAH
jgi:Spy/CpxP family protein refolding chaperone